MKKEMRLREKYINLVMLRVKVIKCLTICLKGSKVEEKGVKCDMKKNGS